MQRDIVAFRTLALPRRRRRLHAPVPWSFRLHPFANGHVLLWVVEEAMRANQTTAAALLAIPTIGSCTTAIRSEKQIGVVMK